MALRTIRTGSWCRTFASGSHAPHHEQVSVRCASSGHITVDLHNHLYHPPTAPLVIYLPSFSRPPHLSPPLPEFIKRYPTAVINYRWPEDSLISDPVPAGQNNQPEDDGIIPTNPLHWPTPIHDTLFGYSWITDNLVPPENQRRDIYVVGSYLGASLAASLALTESHIHERMAVRGVALYNGIYDWTAFLPPQNNNPANPDALAAMKSLLELPDDDVEGSAMHYLRQLVPTLFKTPSNLFDPFASAVLFFRSTGLLVPSSFEPSDSTIPPELERAIAELSLDETSTPAPGSPEAARLEVAFKAPRKGYMAFPTRQSMLRIPEALILHETGTAQPVRGKWRKRGTAARNDFASQAKELARVMRRSISMYELRERMRVDDVDEGGAEAERRVQLRDIGTEDVAEEALGPVVEEWLEEKMDACNVPA
ncbi:hypothetical protein MCOR25_004191 [Pyricularia grisea]|uniref:Alpha/beta hydrolase fold-3 domain-containing protein n=1 Tax=Pyricularia grisea TaxID=148305 RepID=A0A6P8AV71_PYRGI|nr:uncharacterized protein PgNI_08330 [Pyricularia grisea]KAI6370454.1 hypothetical protein MCOR25_004191 [Pyricularia grisea]TLD06100.1 hypothetical protein PgNI_08330 [Pyricularia grisea]